LRLAVCFERRGWLKLPPAHSSADEGDGERHGDGRHEALDPMFGEHVIDPGQTTTPGQGMGIRLGVVGAGTCARLGANMHDQTLRGFNLWL
jgi:hypothetical protein